MYRVVDREWDDVKSKVERPSRPMVEATGSQGDDFSPADPASCLYQVSCQYRLADTSQRIVEGVS